MRYVPCIIALQLLVSRATFEAVSHWVLLFPVSLHCMVKPVAHARTAAGRTESRDVLVWPVGLD